MREAYRFRILMRVDQWISETAGDQRDAGEVKVGVGERVKGDNRIHVIIERSDMTGYALVIAYNTISFTYIFNIHRII